MSIPQSFIQELLSRVDVVDIVGKYVQLKKGGANFMGLCPFHGEKSPSFSVSPSKQFYHCFGCGKNGNAIGFLMDHTGMGFREAVTDLAQSVGLPVPEDDVSPQQRERAAQAREKQTSLTDLLEKAGDAYRKQLSQSTRAIDYFKRRGVSGATAKRFGLGYAPEGWRALASVFPAYDDAQLVEAGLVIEAEGENGADAKRYDRFRDRVMFPIRNVKGECIGFGGRVLGDEKPKYLNSPETPVFHKGRELYGLFEARTAIREHGYALVTEGYMDVVALAQLGFPNAVATLGTACTPDHVHKLFRFTDTAVFSFDGDAAGRRAARKALDGALPYATDTRSIKFLFLPAEHDPDSFVREYGADAFARHVHDATPLSRFLLEAAADGCDLGQAEGRARMSSNARPLWNLLPDGALKRQLLAELADKAQLPSHELDSLWQKTTAQELARQNAGGAPRPSVPNTANNSYSAPAWDGAMEAMPVYADAPPWEQDNSGMDRFPGQRADGYGQGGQHRTGFEQRPGGNNWGGRSKFGGKGNWKDRPVPQPPMPSVAVTRQDQAARLLLSHMAFLENFSPEDTATLAQLDAPYGALFGWMEQQFLAHGAQSWAVLREHLRGHMIEEFATQLMQGHHAQIDGPLDEIRAELRDSLSRIVLDQLEAQNRLLITQSSDPAALRTYQSNFQRIGQLKRQVNK
ncbi:MAG: DNA primase [Comamonas sp.]